MSGIELENLDNFCIAPWINLHIDTQEQIKPCCKGAGIALPLDDIDSYLQNNYQALTSLQKQLSQNQQPEGCVGCQEKNWYGEFLDMDVDLTRPLNLKSLDIRWSNTCQLTCTYCNENQSSSWGAKFKKNIPIKNNRILNGKQKLLDLIDAQKSQIHRLSLLGGEPLLIKENQVILEKISPNTKIEIFTNLNCDLKNNYVFSMLIERPNVQWMVSMENVGKKFEFVRRNASWKKQVNNIEQLIQKSQSKTTVTLQSQFCVYSATSMLELYQWTKNYNLKINWNWLNHPKPLDFSLFPDRFKLLSLDQIDQVNHMTSRYDFEYNIDWIADKILETMNQSHEDHVERCFLWHQEQERKFFDNEMDFKNLWPEYS
jgi:organic radical activating enzyme